MSVRFLGLLLLALLPESEAAQFCSPPVFSGGYVFPERNRYLHESTLTFSCDADHKPLAEGWWATSMCQDGTWSPEPRCIAKASCLPPTISNGKYTQSQSGWYENADTITVTCNPGYQPHSSTIRCTKGKWSDSSVCDKSRSACDKPPKIPNAVIINQGPQEAYSVNSKLHYQCKEGHDTDPPNADKSITCRAGAWTQGPSCTVSVDCVFDPARYYGPGQYQIIKMKDGDKKKIRCLESWPNFWTLVQCKDKRTLISNCCHPHDIDRNLCRFTNVN